MFFALALSTPLFVLSAEAIVYTVRTDSGPVTYSLEVPPGTPVGDKIKPHPQVGYSANFPMTAAGSTQTFYAAVLDDGNLVRPVPVSRYAYHPVRRSREKWGGSGEKKKWKSGGRVLGEAADGREMGGAELKEKWGGSEKKPSN
jgi:hypothetical protein